MSILSENLLSLRRLRQLTQEQAAERVGVTRQALAKWESGETLPDVERCRLLAQLYGVTLDALVCDADTPELPPPSRGKHIFGVVRVGDKGQIVIPQQARKVFNIIPGDMLVVLGDEAQGLALIRESDLLALAQAVRCCPHEGGKDA